MTDRYRHANRAPLGHRAGRAVVRWIVVGALAVCVLGALALLLALCGIAAVYAWTWLASPIG